MSKHSKGKKRSKESQLAIRVDKTERDTFVGLCEKLDTTAAREIRRFMREYVAAHSASTAEAVPSSASEYDGASDEAASQKATEAKAPDSSDLEEVQEVTVVDERKSADKSKKKGRKH